MQHNQLNKSTRRLGRQMMFMSIIVSITPLILIVAILTNYYWKTYTKKVVEHIQATIQKHAVDIDTYLNDRLANIKMLSLDSGIDDLKDQAILNRYLEALNIAYHNSYSDIGLVDSEGRQVAYAGPFSLKKADYGQAPWFRSAIGQDEYVSDVFLGLRRIPHFIVTVKKPGPKGRDWLLRATIDFAEFNQIVKGIRMGRTGSAYIINREGEFQTERRTEGTEDEATLKDLASQGFGKAQVMFREMPDPAGRQVLYVTAPIKKGQWILVYSQEKADALSQLSLITKIAGLIMVLGSVGIVLTVVFLTKRTVARISRAEHEQEAMQKQVIEAGKLAAIGELAAGIAHEINNPVAIMIENAGWVQDLLSKEDVSCISQYEEIANSLQEISTQGIRCKDITHKLLSFARKTDARLKEVNINDLLEELVNFSAQKGKYKKVEIRTEFAPDLPVLHASPSELQQVVLNLLNNSIDAIDKDNGVIVVRTRLEGEYIAIDVADNGQGIPGQIIGRIFEPFFTTKDVGKGTGLGLSICYGIIEKMGGKITVESKINEGTNFHVCIPIERKVEK
ncbi:MAG: two-component sensor histidine kinase [Desulfovibrionaceae bacterium]|nr:two-component sensor histidine kinase [Desulfovibrionaceae bacterium]